MALREVWLKQNRTVMKKFTTSLLIALGIYAQAVYAQQPEKLADINSILEPTVAFSHNMWVDDNKVFFTNEQGYLGVYDGANYSVIQQHSAIEVVSVNGTVYFAANNGGAGRELFKYDGSTTTLIDLNPSGDSNPLYLTAIGSDLYFSADNGSDGRELWKYDGATATQIDIVEGSVGSSPERLVAYGSELVFFAEDGVNGRELWKCTGTSAELIQDIRSGSIGSNGSDNPYFENHDGKLYFSANDGVGVELFEYDGSTTTKIDVNGTSGGTSPRYLTSFGSNLYFAASITSTGNELYQYDGSVPSLVTDIQVGTGSSIPNPSTKDQKFKVVNGNMYFQANDGTNGSELYKYNGTTLTRIDVNPNSGDLSGNGYIDFIGSMGNSIYFQGYGGSAFGSELWKYDGTTLTQIEIRSGSDGSAVRHMTEINGELYFTAYYGDDTNDWHLWKYTGTNASVVNLTGITHYSDPYYFTKVGNRIYFSADDGIHGSELWYTDGTTTEMVADIYPGEDGSSPNNLIEFDSKLVFFAEDDEGYKMIVFDGSNFQTFEIEGTDEDPIIFNGDLYFGGNNGVNGTELLKFDGTSVTLVQDINPSGSSDARDFYIWGSDLYFSAQDGTNGRQLWKYDGTEATLELDLRDDDGDSSPRRLRELGSNLYFEAYTPTTGDELFKYDGTTATAIDVNVGSQSSNIQYVVEYQGSLFFYANDVAIDTELYEYDGENLTLHDLNSEDSSYPSYLTVYNDILYFQARDDANGNEMWSYDGVSFDVIDINPGPSNSYVYNFFLHGPYLYFNADNGSDGYGMYRFDATGDPEYLGSPVEYYADQEHDYAYMDDYIYFQGAVQSDYEPWKLRAISQENDILTFSVASQMSNAVIDDEAHTINVELVYGSGVTNLNPIITVSEYAQVTPSGAQDFSSPFVYTVTSEYGVPQEWTVTVSVSDVLSIEDQWDVNVYPNPTSDILRVSSKEALSVKVFDLNGRIMTQTSGREIQVDMSNLKTGLYLVQLSQGNQSITHKVIKTN